MTISAKNVKEIQQEGDWFIFLLEDDYDGGARNELRKSLGAFVVDIGRRNWVVEGHYNEKREFISTVYHEFKLYLGEYSDFKRFPVPALLVTNGLPQKADVDGLIRIIIPLQGFYEKPGDTAQLLKELAISLQEPDAAHQLMKLDKERVETIWGWLGKYARKGINIIGVAADVIAILGLIAGK